MITFRHVTKHYEKRSSGNSFRSELSRRRQPARDAFVALDNVSFRVEEGSALGIVGSNGAGKSTLLKLLTRITRPTSGSITVRGRMSSLLEVGAGFHHDLNGYENIFLSGAILGMSRRRIQLCLDDIVDFSGLHNFMSAPVYTYSSGMFLRLAFSVGVHLDSDILVIDEALAVGDRDFQSRCQNKIHQFRQHGGTIVLVSHDDDQLRAICDRGIFLANGSVLYDGDIHSALGQYEALRDICNSD